MMVAWQFGGKYRFDIEAIQERYLPFQTCVLDRLVPWIYARSQVSVH
jgi:hypothetical protein